MTRHQVQAIALCNSSQDQLRLHHRKVVADALPWPTPKGEVGVVRATGRAFGGKALRIEHLRLLPERRVTVRRVGTEPDHTVSRNMVPSNLVLGDRFATEDPGRWVEPQRLLKYHACIGQLRQALQRWQLSSKHFVQFCIQSTLDMRVLGEQVPAPGEEIGGGLMAPPPGALSLHRAVVCHSSPGPSPRHAPTITGRAGHLFPYPRVVGGAA